MSSQHPKDMSLRTDNNSWHAHLVKNHGSDETHLQVETQNISGRELTLPSKDFYVKNINHNFTIIPPDTSINSSFLVNGGKIEFDLSSDSFNVRSMILQMKIRNSSATTAQRLTPIPLVIDEVRLLGNGQTEIQLMTGQDIFLNEGTFKSRSQLDNESPTNNMTSNYVAFLSIAAGNTATYYLPLSDILPKDGNMDGFPLFNIKKLKLEVRFRGADCIEVDSSAGDGLPLLLDDLQLFLETTHYTRAETMALDKIYKDGISFKYLYFHRQSFDQTLAPSTKYNFKVNSIRGLTPYMWISIHPQGASGQDLYNPASITSWIDLIEWRDDSNTSQTNSHKYPGDYLKYTISSQKLDNLFGFQCRNSYFISFGAQPYVAYHEGVNLGYSFVDDSNFEITTKASLAGGNYTIRFIVPTFALLHITPQGQLLFEK